jgi:hypothetical protein
MATEDVTSTASCTLESAEVGIEISGRRSSTINFSTGKYIGHWKA